MHSQKSLTTWVLVAHQNGLEAPVAPVQADSGSAARAHSQTPSMEESHADAVLAAVADALPKFVPHMLINARVGTASLLLCLHSIAAALGATMLTRAAS